MGRFLSQLCGTQHSLSPTSALSFGVSVSPMRLHTKLRLPLSVPAFACVALSSRRAATHGSYQHSKKEQPTAF